MSDRVLAAQTAKPPALCRRLAALPSSPTGAELARGRRTDNGPTEGIIRPASSSLKQRPRAICLSLARLN